MFDKAGNVAFLEVKSSAQYSRRWILPFFNGLLVVGAHSAAP